MKSRREAELRSRVSGRSGAAETEVKRVATVLERISRQSTKPAEPRVPRTAPAPSQKGQRPGGKAPADAHADENDDVNDIVAPEIEDAAPSRLLEFEPRQLPVASVEDRMGEKQERANGLHARAKGQEKWPAADPNCDGDQAHLIGLIAVPRGGVKSQRNRPLDVARHEPIGVLDQRLEEAALGGADIRWRLERSSGRPQQDPRWRAKARASAPRRQPGPGRPIRSSVSAASQAELPEE